MAALWADETAWMKAATRAESGSTKERLMAGMMVAMTVAKMAVKTVVMMV